jgi:hypothetical protein
VGQSFLRAASFRFRDRRLCLAESTFECDQEKGRRSCRRPKSSKKNKVGYAVSATTLGFARLFGFLWPLEMASGAVCLTGLDVLVFAAPHAKGLLVIIIDIAAYSLEEAVRVDSAIARQQHAFKGKTRPGHSRDDQASRQKSSYFHVLVSSPAAKIGAPRCLGAQNWVPGSNETILPDIHQTPALLSQTFPPSTATG